MGTYRVAKGFEWERDKPIARGKREPVPAAQALNDYALQGSTRSFEKLLAYYDQMNGMWGKYQADPTTWIQSQMKPPEEPPTLALKRLKYWRDKFAWEARLDRWDEMKKRLEQLEFDARRAEIKRKRIDILELAMTRLQGALVSLNPKDASWGEVTAGVAKITDALRIEMGDTGAGGGGMARPRIQMVVVNAGGGKVEAGSRVLDGVVRDALALQSGGGGDSSDEDEKE